MEFRCPEKVRTRLLLLLIGAQHVAITDQPHPYPFPYDIQNVLHLTLPILRILLLVLLSFALTNPVVTYAMVTSADPPVSTTPLLSSSHERVTHQGRNYGTLDNGRYTPTAERAPDLPAQEDAADRTEVSP
jgi:hypothetical protein